MLPSGLQEAGSALLISKYQKLLDHARALDYHAPTHLSGRGIVICAGGPRLFTCAWVLIHQLREVLRCTLPIQVWYAGAAEMDAHMIALLQVLARVEAIDATQVPGYERIRPHPGWALKPFALVNSQFREVLMVDADNLPVVDPEFLFDDPRYVETGAIFWPDLEPVRKTSAIWEVTRVPYREEPSFESGQLLVDKSRSRKALMLAMHLNENARFYYTLIHGDKDTFHFAWRMAGCPYAMPGNVPGRLEADVYPELVHIGPVLLQAGFDGRLIFQHRNWPKWFAFGANPRYPGFLYEQECLGFLARLAEAWDGRISKPAPPPPPAYWQSPTGTRWFNYVLVGSTDRLMEFLPDHRIGWGATTNEQEWAIIQNQGQQNQGQPTLVIVGEHGITCRLTRDTDGVWRGRWQIDECGNVELVPFAAESQA